MAKGISQISVLASELIEPPPPIMWLAEMTTSFQLAESHHDEFPGVETCGITGTTITQTGVMQRSNCRWIEAEEVQPPSVRPITFQPIEKTPIAIVQQALPEVLAIAAMDQALTSCGNLQKLVTERKRRVWHRPCP